MKAWKKVVATAVAALMVGTLAACGGGTKSTGETTAAAAAAEQTTAAAAAAAQTTAAAAAPAASGDIADKKIGISIYKFDDNFMTLYRNELERILVEDMGFKKENVVIQDGKGDQAEQTNQIKNFITQQYDVLILNLVQSSSASEITDICNDAGIPV
ncbi:MAG: substrate-binding domain-containing protein, partial [Lachnospiraceae bacterium]|nr:substrate-binding domain-containing protein [Lachnospiraceae bacterium]